VKLTCKQQDLAKGLSIVSHAVSTRATLPILLNVRLAAEGESIRLSATNLEIGITCHVPATVQEEGVTTIPARLLTEFVNTLPPGDVTLALQAGGAQSLKVSGKGSQATIRGMDPGEFPTIPTGDGQQSRDDMAPITLEAGELRAMIGHVAFAAATDDARPVFTGVLARVRDDRLTFAAADSFRLAVRSTGLLPAGGGGVATAVGDILIPARTLTELGRVLPDEGTVRVIVTPNRNQVLFAAPGLELVSNLLAGQFPNYEAILPKTSATTVTLETEGFRAAAKRAAIFARDSANVVRLKITAGEAGGLTPGAVTLEATAEEGGDTTSTLDAAVDGSGMEVIFNVKYLTDVLGVIATPQVILGVNSPQSPGVIRPVGETDDSARYTYVIMPMHSTR
jgi:DNA polymerase-3 subunit beta